MRGLSILLLAFALMASFVTPTLAGPDEDRTAAEKLIQDGLSLARTKKFRDAVKKFEDAYKLYPHPEIQHNLARAHEELGELTRAYDYFSAALQNDYAFAPDGRLRLARIDAELRKTHARLVVRTTPSQSRVVLTYPTGTELTHTQSPFATWAPAGKSRLVGTNPNFKTTELAVDLVAGEDRVVSFVLQPIPRQGFIQLSINVAGAAVTLAGTPVGKSPLGSVTYDAGVYDLEVRLKGYKPHRESVAVVVDQVTSLNVVLMPEIAGDTPLVETSSGSSWLGWAFIGTGVVAGGAAAYLQFVKALPAENDAEALDPGPATDAEYNRLIRRAEGFQTAAIVTAIVGGALVGTGIILLATDSGGEPEPSTGLLFTPTFAVSPSSAFVGGHLRF